MSTGAVLHNRRRHQRDFLHPVPSWFFLHGCDGCNELLYLCNWDVLWPGRHRVSELPRRKLLPINCPHGAISVVFWDAPPPTDERPRAVAQVPTLCPAGRYSTAIGQVVSSTCAACPAGTTSSPGSVACYTAHSMCPNTSWVPWIDDGSEGASSCFTMMSTPSATFASASTGCPPYSHLLTFN